jgi:chemotaxis protein methyltransferase CheR
VILVRALANQGRLREADEQCTRALDHHRGSAELHYLHALLLSAAGQHVESTKAARRAIYLDPRFVMAHLQMGEALARMDDTARAALAFQNATKLLAGVTDDVHVDGSDRVSASRLRQIAELRLRDLTDGRPST